MQPVLKFEVSFAVHPQHLAAAKEVASRLSVSASGVSEHCQCESEFSSDGRDLTLTATLHDETDTPAFFAAIGPLIDHLEGPCSLTGLKCFGDVPQALQQALSRFEPTFYAVRPQHS